MRLRSWVARRTLPMIGPTLVELGLWILAFTLIAAAIHWVRRRW